MKARSLLDSVTVRREVSRSERDLTGSVRGMLESRDVQYHSLPAFSYGNLDFTFDAKSKNKIFRPRLVIVEHIIKPTTLLDC